MTNPNKIEIDVGQKLDQLADEIANNKTQIVESKNELSNKISNTKNQLATEIKLVKNDLTLIKWLFGIFSSLIIVLLSTILTVLFKLLGSL